MKVFFKIMAFSGGAPLSMLEYVKLVRQSGHEVVVAGEFSDCQAKFADEDIALYDLPCFDIHKPLRNIAAFARLAKVLNKEKPDFLVWWTGYESIFGRLTALYYGLPALYVYAGGEMLAYIGKAIKDVPMLVFSEENKTALLAQGYDPSQVEVVTNRLCVGSPDDGISSFYAGLAEGGILRLLIPSRLDISKLNSLSTAIEIAEGLHRRFGSVQLAIAGNGECAGQVRQLAEQANARAGYEIIRLLGYVDNVQSLFRQAHIVFGKGRSVIEPVMIGRLGIVLGEDGKASLCSTDSVANLACFNFAGRNIARPLGYGELEAIVGQLLAGTYDFADLEATRAQVRSLYDISHAGQRIANMLESRLAAEKGKACTGFCGLVYCISEYCRIYWLAIVDKVRHKMALLID